MEEVLVAEQQVLAAHLRLLHDVVCDVAVVHDVGAGGGEEVERVGGHLAQVEVVGLDRAQDAAVVELEQGRLQLAVHLE